MNRYSDLVGPQTPQREILVSALPVGAKEPMPGGLAVRPDGTICIAADSEGSILALRRI